MPNFVEIMNKALSGDQKICIGCRACQKDTTTAL